MNLVDVISGNEARKRKARRRNEKLKGDGSKGIELGLSDILALLGVSLGDTGDAVVEATEDTQGLAKEGSESLLSKVPIVGDLFQSDAAKVVAEAMSYTDPGDLLLEAGQNQFKPSTGSKELDTILSDLGIEPEGDDTLSDIFGLLRAGRKSR